MPCAVLIVPNPVSLECRRTQNRTPSRFRKHKGIRGTPEYMQVALRARAFPMHVVWNLARPGRCGLVVLQRSRGGGSQPELWQQPGLEQVPARTTLTDADHALCLTVLKLGIRTRERLSYTVLPAVHCTRRTSRAIRRRRPSERPAGHQDGHAYTA